MEKALKVKGNRPSARERDAAFAKFNELTERQRAIVYQELLWNDIATRWDNVKLASDRYLDSPSSSPFGHSPHASDVLGLFVNNWANHYSANAFPKTEEMIARDRATLEARRNARK